MIVRCSSAQEIQLLYPATPQWAVVEDDTLVELVRHYRFEHILCWTRWSWQSMRHVRVICWTSCAATL